MSGRRWHYVAMAVLLGTTMSAAATDTAATVAAIAAIRSSTGASYAPDGKRITYISNASGSPQV